MDVSPCVEPAVGELTNMQTHSVQRDSSIQGTPFVYCPSQSLHAHQLAFVLPNPVRQTPPSNYLDLDLCSTWKPRQICNIHRTLLSCWEPMSISATRVFSTKHQRKLAIQRSWFWWQRSGFDGPSLAPATASMTVVATFHTSIIEKGLLWVYP